MNYESMFNFIMGIPNLLSEFYTWLFIPLNLIGLCPIEIFTIGAFALIMGFHIVKLLPLT